MQGWAKLMESIDGFKREIGLIVDMATDRNGLNQLNHY